MIDYSSQSFDQAQNSDSIDDESFENDDLVTFQHNSAKIKLYYSQLTKYSKHIREEYLFPDVVNRLPQEIHQFQEEFQLLPESVDFFFQLLQQNYNIKEDLTLTYVQCIDLLKISKYLEVRKLTSKIKQYIISHNIDVDFIFQMLEYNVKTQTTSDNHIVEISNEIENTLTNKINECLSKEKFKELPIEIIYRVIEKSSPDEINSNKLYDMIVKSLSKFYVLFKFLELQKLSDDRLSELCEMYLKSNENTRNYFDYLRCNLDLINEMNNRKKNLEEMNDEQRTKMKELETLLQNQISDSEKVNAKLQSQLDDSNNLISEQQNKMKDLEEKMLSLQNQFNDTKNLNNEHESKMKEFEELLQKQFNEQLQNQIKYSKELENQISELQNKLTTSEKEIVENNENAPFEGQIVASVEKDVFVNAEINLIIKHGILDTTKSKVIVSTSDAKCLGNEAYENGKPITSLHMNTTFGCKIGLYYVRCIVFNTEGESNEIVSNSVTTNKSCLTFDYEGRKPAQISLPQGQYLLEVWGAKGGDSTGNCQSDSTRSNYKTVPGGLGGYSRGILSLNKKETVYVFVGGEGRPSNSSDGLSTEGGYPDGGGTKTGHSSSYTTVPGTGGGSTSIRIGSNSRKARVIVAGGGGGASGNSYHYNPGGFGGGLSGGNVFHVDNLQSQGAGTQVGSTSGLGACDGRHGDRGQFGSGATGKYSQGCDSGGGGGGGWYGGGSGGYGNSQYCSSGGGGSGWTFTESSMKEFQSGDSSNASKFVLTSEYYLRESKCVGGNEEFPCPDGNGNEKGHAGNGYAKITIL